MNNAYKTNFDLVVSENKIFHYDNIKVQNNQIIGSCYVTNYQELFELTMNCSYEMDNINAYVDQFYLVLEDENLYDDLKMILAIWKQKAPLIDNIGFMIHDKMIYQANNHPCAWYHAYMKNQLMKLIVTRSRWDDENDLTYRSQYKNIDQINPSFEPDKLKQEYQAAKMREEYSSQRKEANQFDSNRLRSEEKNQRSNQDGFSSIRNKKEEYASPKKQYDNLRSFNQHQVDDFDLFDDRDQIGEIKNNSLNYQPNLKSFNNSLINDNNNFYLSGYESKFNDSNMAVAKLGAVGFNDSLASLKQRMDDIDQQIGNYESITRELSDLASDSFSFDYANQSSSPTLEISDYSLNSSSAITDTSGFKDLNSYEFNDSTKDLLLNHSDDFND
ncbi:hypothetical protein [[Mycoplasma] imitans]|uniref:hypothetical protein n=1 Tax=[Mycoplasma] imitans TaxID=29560 RepID=UPI00048358D5|nr:hypothetical protein [[Mycoplasma] imitans]